MKTKIEAAKKIIEQGECDIVNCNDCPAYSCDDGCQCLGNTLNWLKNWLAENDPEENMKKVYFESEQEAREFVMINITNVKNVHETKGYLETIKRNGYIKKSAVEEAEEMYREFADNKAKYSNNDIIGKQHEAIQELKAENARLKDE